MGASSDSNCVRQVVATLHPELPEDLPKVILDGARADEELHGDLLVRSALGRKAGDLRLLRCEIPERLGRPFARMLAGRQELAAGTPGKRPGTHFHELRVRASELFARVDPAPASAQPFAVQQVRACEVESDATATQVISQTPAPGSTENKGTSVNLKVSNGPPQVAVPTVVGEGCAILTSDGRTLDGEIDLRFGQDGAIALLSFPIASQMHDGAVITPDL